MATPPSALDLAMERAVLAQHLLHNAVRQDAVDRATATRVARRQAYIRELGRTPIAAAPHTGGGGILGGLEHGAGSIGGWLGRGVVTAGTRIAETPFGVIDMAAAPLQDAISAIQGGRSHHTINLLRGIAQGTIQDYRNFPHDPGGAVLDTLMLASGGATALSKLGEAAAAYRAGEFVPKTTAWATRYRPTHLPGGDEFKGRPLSPEARGSHGTDVTYLPSEESRNLGAKQIAPRGVRGAVGDVLRRVSRQDTETTGAQPLTDENFIIHKKTQGERGIVMETGPLREPGQEGYGTQMALERLPRSVATSTRDAEGNVVPGPQGPQGGRTVWRVWWKPADSGEYRVLKFKPTAEDHAIAAKLGIPIEGVHELGSPLYIEGKAGDIKEQFKAAAEQLHQGRPPHQLDIVQTANMKEASNLQQISESHQALQDFLAQQPTPAAEAAAPAEQRVAAAEPEPTPTPVPGSQGEPLPALPGEGEMPTEASDAELRAIEAEQTGAAPKAAKAANQAAEAAGARPWTSETLPPIKNPLVEKILPYLAEAKRQGVVANRDTVLKQAGIAKNTKGLKMVFDLANKRLARHEASGTLDHPELQIPGRPATAAPPQESAPEVPALTEEQRAQVEKDLEDLAGMGKATPEPVASPVEEQQAEQAARDAAKRSAQAEANSADIRGSIAPKTSGGRTYHEDPEWEAELAQLMGKKTKAPSETQQAAQQQAYEEARYGETAGRQDQPKPAGALPKTKLAQLEADLHFAQTHGADPYELRTLQEEIANEQENMRQAAIEKGEAPPVFGTRQAPPAATPSPAGFTETPRPTRASPSTKGTSTLRQYGIDKRTLQSIGVTEEKIKQVQDEVRAQVRGVQSQGELRQIVHTAVRNAEGKGTADKGMGQWDLQQTKYHPSGGAGQIPFGTRLGAAARAFMSPSLPSERVIGTIEHQVRGGYERRNIKVTQPLPPSALGKALRQTSIDIANAVAGKTPLNPRIAGIVRITRMDKLALRYMKQRETISIRNADAVDSASAIAEHAAGIPHPVDRAAYLAEQVAKLKKSYQAEGKGGGRALDTLNMLQSMGVLYLKGPGYLVPNMIGQAYIAGTDAKWMPWKVMKGLHIVNGMQNLDPVAFEAAMGGMRSSGITSAQQPFLGTKGPVGAAVRTAHQAFTGFYGRSPNWSIKRPWRVSGLGLDRPWRAAALGMELARRGIKTPEEAVKLFSDPARRGEMVNVMQEANLNAIDYTHMSHFERTFLRRVMFFYPWIRASSAWTVRTAMNHPAQLLMQTQAGDIARKQWQSRLPPLPSYLSQVMPGPNINVPLLGNLGHEDIPVVGRVPRVWNPTSASVTGSLGDVLTSGGAYLQGRVAKSEALSRFLNPGASYAIGQITHVDPFTQAAYKPGQTPQGMFFHDVGQLVAPASIIGDTLKARQIAGGNVPGIENRLEPKTLSDVAGRTMFGAGPIPLNPKESESRAAADVTSLMNPKQKVYYNVQRTRQAWLDAAKKVDAATKGQSGLLVNGKLPQPVVKALLVSATRDRNLAAFQEQFGHKLQPIERIHADLHMLQQTKQIAPKEAAQLRAFLEGAPESTQRTWMRNLREAVLRAGNAYSVINNYRRQLNAALESIGEAPIG